MRRRIAATALIAIASARGGERDPRRAGPGRKPADLLQRRASRPTRCRATGRRRSRSRRRGGSRPRTAAIPRSCAVSRSPSTANGRLSTRGLPTCTSAPPAVDLDRGRAGALRAGAGRPRRLRRRPRPHRRVPARPRPAPRLQRPARRQAGAAAPFLRDRPGAGDLRPAAHDRRVAGKGDFGTVLSTRIPKLAGGLGSITDIELTHRPHSTTTAAQRRSFISASCAAPAGFPGAIFPFARGTFHFADGTQVDTTLTRDCRVRCRLALAQRPRPPTPALVPAEVVGQLVPQGPLDLVARAARDRGRNRAPACRGRSRSGLRGRSRAIAVAEVLAVGPRLGAEVGDDHRQTHRARAGIPRAGRRSRLPPAIRSRPADPGSLGQRYPATIGEWIDERRSNRPARSFAPSPSSPSRRSPLPAWSGPGAEATTPATAPTRPSRKSNRAPARPKKASTKAPKGRRRVSKKPRSSSKKEKAAPRRDSKRVSKRPKRDSKKARPRPRRASKKPKNRSERYLP